MCCAVSAVSLDMASRVGEVDQSTHTKESLDTKWTGFLQSSPIECEMTCILERTYAPARVCVCVSACVCVIGQDRTGQDRAPQDKARHDTTRHDTTRHDTTRHDSTRQAIDGSFVVEVGISRMLFFRRIHCASRADHSQKTGTKTKTKKKRHDKTTRRDGTQNTKDEGQEQKQEAAQKRLSKPLASVCTTLAVGRKADADVCLVM